MTKHDLIERIAVLERQQVEIIAILCDAIDGPHLPNIVNRHINDALYILGVKTERGVWGWKVCNPATDAAQQQESER